jgi:tetratricopeptide (TPR) repeat protein
MKVLFIVAVFLFATNLHSQQDASVSTADQPSTMQRNRGTRVASVHGHLFTSDGSPASSVLVRITGAYGSYVMSTNSAGEFQFINLPMGTYALEAESGGSFVQHTLMLNTDVPDLTLQVGDSNVTQKAASGGSVSIQQLKVPDKARNEYEDAVHELAKNNSDKAEKKLAQAMEHFSCYSDALATKSVLDLSRGRTNLAADEAQQAIRCDASNPKAYFVLGAALNVQGQHLDAIRTINEGIRFKPDAWQPYYELGKAFIGLRRFTEAISQLTKAEQIAGDAFAPIHVTLGSAFLGIQNYAAARNQFLLFLKKAPPQDPDALQVKKVVGEIDAKIGPGALQSQK